MDSNFNSELFLIQVREDVRSELNRTIDRLEADLVHVSAFKKSKLDEGQLKECCQKFRKILARHFSVNIKKFEIYSDENIFRKANKTDSRSGIGATAKNTLQQLRAEYETEREEFEGLTREKQELAALLREMQSSLFDLRVSGQVIDSLSLQPLDEALARISQQVRQLSGMCSNADAIVSMMKDDSVDASTIDFSSEDLIMTGNIEDINLLAEQFEN